MEYIDLVNRIISAEHSASALAQEAREKQASLDADLERECAQLRQRYLERPAPDLHCGGDRGAARRGIHGRGG